MDKEVISIDVCMPVEVYMTHFGGSGHSFWNLLSKMASVGGQHLGKKYILSVTNNINIQT